MSDAVRPPSAGLRAGGTLTEDNLYVERPVDAALYNALRAGRYCHVLAPRQIGKSSLQARVARRLASTGVRAVTVDLSMMGTHDVTPSQFYRGLVNAVARALDLRDAARELWAGAEGEAPVTRWSRFLREVVIEGVAGAVVIFFDEIDGVRALPFPADDLFASIRAAYNARATDAAFDRLTFCLVGVASPGDLIADPARTPFNIGEAIRVEDFTRGDLDVFAPELAEAGDASALLDAIFHWTEGHPYLTQWLCVQLSLQGPRDDESAAGRVDALVVENFPASRPACGGPFESAERLLLSIPDALLRDRALQRYGDLLQGARERADPGDLAQSCLRLAGAAADRPSPDGPEVRVRNPLFARVLDARWLQERTSDELLKAAVQRWLASKRHPDDLLRGRTLDEVSASARRQKLTPEEQEFLTESRRARTFRTTLRAGAGLSLAAALVLAGLFIHARTQQHRAERAEAEARRNERELRSVNDRLVQTRRRELLERASALLRAPGAEIDAVVAALQAVSASPRGDPSEAARVDLLLAATGRALHSFPLDGHRGAVRGVAYSPDGRALATVGDDGALRVWDATNGSSQTALEGDVPLRSVAWGRPDEVVVGDERGTVRHWDRAAGREVARWSLGNSPVTTLAFSPDRAALLVTAADGSSRLRVTHAGGSPAETYELPRAAGLAGASDARAGVPPETEREATGAFSADGSRVAAVDPRGGLRVWDAPTRSPVYDLAPPPVPLHLATFPPDQADALILATANRELQWRPFDDRPPRSLGVSLDQIRTLASTRRRPWILSGGDDRMLTLRETAAAHDTTVAEVHLQGHSSSVRALAFSPDGAQIASGGDDGSVRLWPLRHPSVERLVEPVGAVWWAALSRDGARVLAANDAGTVSLWDRDARRALYSIHVGARVWCAALIPGDAPRVVTASADRTIRVWDVATARALVTLPVEAEANWVDVSPDGTRVVAAVGEKALVWRLAGTSLAASHTLEAHRGRVFMAGFSSDGRRIVTASGDGSALLWDAESGRVMGAPMRHRLAVTHAAVSPDGGLVATAGADRRVQLWSADDGRPRGTLETHQAVVASVRFSPDGRRLVSASHDGTVRLWRVTAEGSFDEASETVLRGPWGAVHAASFSADGRRVIFAGWDGSIWLLPVDREGVGRLGCDLLRALPAWERVREACR